MSQPNQNRFERNKKAVYAVLYSFIGLAVLAVCLFGVKIVRDEIHRGFERFIVLREPRPASNLATRPSKELLSEADNLEDREYRLRVDEYGYILPSRIHQTPDASIVFLGGSTTECHFMDEDARFPYLVGRLLEKSTGLRINSYNSGNAGNNSLHCVLMLQAKVPPLHPRFAVFMESINDLNWLTYSGSYWNPHSTRGIVLDKEYNPIKQYIIDKFIGHHSAVPVAGDEFEAIRAKTVNLTVSKAVALYRKNVELFIFFSRQHGIEPVLMTQFNRFTEVLPDNLKRQFSPMETSRHIGYGQYRSMYMAFNQALRDISREQGVRLIDLDREVPKTSEYMYDVVHLNANGSRLVAGIIAKSLEPGLR